MPALLLRFVNSYPYQGRRNNRGHFDLPFATSTQALQSVRHLITPDKSHRALLLAKFLL
jgi:hypothetical protein